MKLSHLGRLCLCAALPLMATACTTPAKAPDYTAFRSAKPRSILILPPVNHTPDVNASNGLIAQMTHPLAEGGYYVVPVAVEIETFRQNGLDTPDDIMQAPAAKLQSVFGADAALYTTITAYGSVYQVLSSNTVVTATSKLVDLKTGSVLWSGSGTANSGDVGDPQVAAGGIIGLLVTAAVKQAVHNLTDQSFDVAHVAAERLLRVGPPDGLLYGPRSVKYGTD
ncbi:DUF799 domain-containing protein [Acetobacter malorum]|uniref:DUF799 domain-containing protein n=1 Tax=Acetobacter malorum TaxID=178901 RepID=UPI0015C50239|nr:DUF799 domain-containing protein [Acetobacter malorum]